MIYYLNGKLVDILNDSIVIDVNGVGYNVLIPSSYMSKLPPLGNPYKVFTYHHVREDQELLFGFSSKTEKSLFLKLTSVSGVGPKVAIKILSELNAEQLTQAIVGAHIPTLVAISGVGKKMAERLIIELKDKCDDIHHNSENTPAQTGLNAAYLDDLTLALKTLGYTRDEIKKSITKAGSTLSAKEPIQSSIKLVLKHI